VVIIAEDIDSEFVDYCSRLSEDDVLFARHPFKMFVLFESLSSSSTYFSEL